MHGNDLEPPQLLPLPAPPTPPEGPLERSARRTVQALRDEGLLEASHELTAELVLQLAQAVDRGLRAGKVSVATATLSRHLLDATAQLPKPVTQSDKFEQLLERMTSATEAGRA